MVLLRPGVSVDDAIESLRTLKGGVDNARARSSGKFYEAQRSYIDWVERAAEPQLRRLFVASEVWQSLYWDRYWYIRSLAAGKDEQPYTVLHAEEEWQSERISSLIHILVNARDSLRSHSGIVVIPDTNVLVNFRRLDEVKWNELVKSDARLVLPLAVVDELDRLSYRAHPVSSRARGVLKVLQAASKGQEDVSRPVGLKPGVTLQYLLDIPGHVRHDSLDEEILSRAEFVNSIVDEVVIATGDRGMQLRAGMRSLAWTAMPDKLRLAQRGDAGLVRGKMKSNY